MTGKPAITDPTGAPGTVPTTHTPTGEAPAGLAFAALVGNPWSRQPGEKLRHYQWFRRFLTMGEARNIEGAWRGATGRGRPHRAPSSWFKAARQWRWLDRAAAYDVAQKAPPLPDEAVFSQAMVRLARQVLAVTTTPTPHGLTIVGPATATERRGIEALAAIVAAIDYAAIRATGDR